MRKSKARVWVAGFILALLCGCGADSASPAEQEGQILELLQRQEAAWNRGDLDGFMQGYWKSEELTFYSGASIQNGWQAAMDRYRRRYQGEGRTMGRLAFTGLSIRMLSLETAFVRGRWQLEMPDGSRPQGLFTLIVRKLPQGWRIVHDHTSSGE